jgi:hypothetical protein
VEPIGLREVRLPTFADNRLRDGGEVANLYHRPVALYSCPQEDSCYSFLLEDESTLGP